MKTTHPSGNMPKCWSQRLWWISVPLALVLAYLVLSNFEMGYWVFLISLGAFVSAGYMGGYWLGTLIDRKYRTEKGLRRQERRTGRALLRWLRRVARRKRDRLEPVVLRRLEEGIQRLADGLGNPAASREELFAERRRMEEFAEEHLRRFRKSVVREYVESIGFAVLIALFLRAFFIEAFQIPSGSMIPSLRVGDHIFVNKLAYGVRLPLLPLKIFGKRIGAVSWNWSQPRRGDVIVFITPENEEEDYIKRVVAVAGDTLAIQDNQLIVNGQPVAQDDRGSFEYNELDQNGRFVGVVETRRFEETFEGGRPHPMLRKSCESDRDCLRIDAACDRDKKLCQQGHYTFQPELNHPEQRLWGPWTVPAGYVFCMGDNRDNSRDSRFWGPVPLEFIKGRAEFIWWSYREERVQWERMFTAIE